MCSHGAIPPFNDFLGTFLRHVLIVPSQLHPNGNAILLGLCVLFSWTLNRLPTFEEIHFLCTFGKGKDHSSIVNFRGARNRHLILDLPETAHGFLINSFTCGAQWASTPSGEKKMRLHISIYFTLSLYYLLTIECYLHPSLQFFRLFPRVLLLSSRLSKDWKQLTKGKEALSFCLRMNSFIDLNCSILHEASFLVRFLLLQVPRWMCPMPPHRWKSQLLQSLKGKPF